MTDEAAAFWDDRYGDGGPIWSGEPNEALVRLVAGSTPGRAVDLGCGEGGDSVWLARQGWVVTGVDIAERALARAGERAAAHGLRPGQTEWIGADLASWCPAGPYDLVSACFLHSPVDFPRTDVLRRAAAAVAPRGSLLIVAHAEPPPWAEEHGHGHDHDRHRVDPDRELAQLDLDAGAWDTLECGVHPRQATGPKGEQGTLLDSVVFLCRR